MLTLELARHLAAAGMTWEPTRGDRFVVPDRGMDDEVFVVSDLTVEVHHFPTGQVIGFNGTTEWALDSLEVDEVVWLPREEQLRAVLGPGFVRLERVPGGFAVEHLVASALHREVDLDPERAYARAVLAHLAAAS